MNAELDQALLRSHEEHHARLDKHISEVYPRDRELVWASGRFAGRRARIVTVHWEVNFEGKVDVRFHVRTQSASGRFWMSPYAKASRMFYPADKFAAAGAPVPPVDKPEITSFKFTMTKKPRRKPQVGDRKTVRGETFERRHVYSDGMQIVRNGRPVFDWVRVEVKS